jgi:hypothetical protein
MEVGGLMGLLVDQESCAGKALILIRVIELTKRPLEVGLPRFSLTELGVYRIPCECRAVCIIEKCCTIQENMEHQINLWL